MFAATNSSAGANPAVGFVACAVSTVFFGSNYAVIRGHDIGDGMFVQWVMAVVIFLTGFVVHAIRHFPPFHPLAMLGGFLWATGNLTSIPIIQMIGMALGILIWSSTNMLLGWASGRFGWFGLLEEKPALPWLNYLGVVVATLASIVFFFVQSHHRVTDSLAYPLVVDDMDQENVEVVPDVLLSDKEHDDSNVFHRMPKTVRTVVGIVLSLIAGCFYGLNFAPVIYIIDNVEGASTNHLDYVFAHYTGIILSSTVYMIIYAALSRNQPHIKPQLFLPACACGLMWALAQTAWFVANGEISEAISFPIISRMPGVVAALWGVLFFKEIRGRRNFIILVVAIVVSLLGTILTGLSKDPL